MAKEPTEENHRFRIICETDRDHMGHILATLTLMGVKDIGYELITDVKTFGRGGKRNGPTAPDLTIAFLESHPTFHVRELSAHLEEFGRHKYAAHNAVRSLVEKNVLRDLGDGNYQNAAIKHIEGPRPAARALPAPPPATKPRSHKSKSKPKKVRAAVPEGKRKRPPNPIARFDVPNRTLIERKIRGRKRFTVKELQAYFAEEGRNEKSVSPILTKMLQAKMIKQTPTPGEYEVVPAKSSNKKRNDAAAATTPTAGVSAPDVMEEALDG